MIHKCVPRLRQAAEADRKRAAIRAKEDADRRRVRKMLTLSKLMYKSKKATAMVPGRGLDDLFKLLPGATISPATAEAGAGGRGGAGTRDRRTSFLALPKEEPPTACEVEDPHKHHRRIDMLPVRPATSPLRGDEEGEVFSGIEVIGSSGVASDR